MDHTNEPRLLIVSYSYSGHTHRLAEAIQHLTGGDWCEIYLAALSRGLPRTAGTGPEGDPGTVLSQIAACRPHAPALPGDPGGHPQLVRHPGAASGLLAVS